VSLVNIVVCLRAPPPGPEVDTLARADALALAQALALGAGDHQTTALLGGTSMEAGSLRLALAAGIDRAVRVAADDMAGTDFHTIGQLLAIALRRIGADLVLTGVRSDDEGLGAAPAAIARHLGANYVAGVEEIALGSAGTVDVVARGGGRKRRLRVKLPAVLTIAAGPETAAQRPRRGGAAPAIEVIPLSDPEATVVRRRTELLGRLEPASRGVETVTSAAALVAALDRR
jgi:electron transfer flavoprotein alpha/beta subunit